MQLRLGCHVSQTLLGPQVTWGSCEDADSDLGGLGRGLRSCISDEAHVMPLPLAAEHPCGREGPGGLSGSPAARRTLGLPPFQHSACFSSR